MPNTLPMLNFRWHIITGEYPPQHGGVSDYTQSVACGLAATGDEVVVWVPQIGGNQTIDPQITVRRLAGQFGLRALALLDRELGRLPGRLLIQYTPHAFGWKSMNLPFCAWLWARRGALDVMFHEVAFPLELGQPLRHSLMAVAHRAMASLLLRSAQRVFISIPGGEPILKKLASRYPRPLWIPIPSNLPTACNIGDIEAIRAQLRSNHTGPLVGHFGTYSPHITRLLEPAVVDLLRQEPEATAVLLGRGGPAFKEHLIRTYRDLGTRFEAPGDLDARKVGAYIACCDVLIQPYPDGISSRRGSAMAGLSLGRAMVTNEGHLTEPFWRKSGAVEIAAPAELTHAARKLLTDAHVRGLLGQRAEDLYRSRFAIEHTIDALRQRVNVNNENMCAKITNNPQSNVNKSQPRV